jgi:RNA polymerase sigma-70 factor, ECF subfamily
MPQPPKSCPGCEESDFGRFRSYLHLLARSHIGPQHRSRLDPSDIVQQTLMNAVERDHQFRGTTSVERVAWLKQILANNLADAVRGLARAKRDVSRERSLDPHHVNDSFMQAESWLAAVQSSPSHHAVRSEEVLHLADALTGLPRLQSEAIVLHHLQGLSLVEVGQQLEKTPAAVAGLLHRGLKRLRALLAGEDRSLPSSEERNA